jgi:hypothetical protein
MNKTLITVIAWIAGISGLLIVLGSIAILVLIDSDRANIEKLDLPVYSMQLVNLEFEGLMIIGLMLTFGALYFNKYLKETRQK